MAEVRTGQDSAMLSRDDFSRRFLERFSDPAFEACREELARLVEVAWSNYDQGRKSPTTRPAGPEFADPDFELSVEWLAAREQVRQAAEEHARPDAPSRVLLVSAAARHEQTCPGEMPKSYRLAELAADELERSGMQVDRLDLSLVNAQYGRQILPCKACVSTAMPLCHWPCSCYPNHGLGQVNDWMNELYPRWVRAHAVLIVTPVYWYQAPAVLKLMMDRLVCADGGNPDPTTTHGKTPADAKALEVQGWSYPRHLAGRLFGVFVHGDAAGAEALRRSLDDWLTDMHLVPVASLDRYIGYYEPYATSHASLDADSAVQEEVRQLARAVARGVTDARAGRRLSMPHRTEEPRPK